MTDVGKRHEAAVNASGRKQLSLAQFPNKSRSDVSPQGSAEAGSGTAGGPSSPGLLKTQLKDPAVLRIADQYPTGGVDQFREILWTPRHRRRLLGLFG